MADCKIVDQSVTTAVGEIHDLSESYKKNGEDFIEALKSAIFLMEGATKDALLTFFTGDVYKFVVEDIPAAIQSMSDLLEANRQNFVDVDQKIADSISAPAQ